MRFSYLILLILSTSLFAQKKVNESVVATELEAHLSFLAADEMRGRSTGSPEIDIAANYLAAQYKIFGVKPVKGGQSFFQEVKLEKIIPPT